MQKREKREISPSRDFYNNILSTMPVQRMPLGPINLNRPLKQELTPWQRSEIQTYRNVGLTNENIAQLTFCSPGTVATTLKLNTLRNDGKTRSRSGRPPALSRRNKRLILRIIRRNSKLTYAQLKIEANVDVHKNTLYRMLKEEGITNWLARKRPLITPEVAAKRLQWAKKHQNWSWEEWSKIIWSDECSLERGKGGRRIWVFRSPYEKYNQEMICPYKKGKDISVMIWGAIHGDGRSDVVIMDRDPDSEKSGYTANSYLTVLNDQLPQTWQPGMTFMQDNASIHTAKKVKKWFEDEGIPVIDWPPYSPDLNPIEHLWAQLKQWINDNHPELNEMGKSEEAYQQLFSAIREGWDAIAHEAIEKLVKGMDDRVNAVLAAGGWYTRF